MSLLEDVKTALDDGYGADDIVGALPDLELVEDEYVDSGRWAEHWRAVYKRTTKTLKLPGDELEHVSRVDEYVAVEYSVPATEMQEVEEPYDDIYVVKPREVVKVVYEKE